MTNCLLIAAVLAGVYVIHEAGHAAAAAALRLPWRPVVSRYRPSIEIGSAEIRLRPWQVRLTAAAGPAANVLVAYAAAPTRLGPFVAVPSLLFAVVNLIPIPYSDGLRILRPRHAIDQALRLQQLRP